ncbi:MAG: flavodoxin family protein [Chloroflexota bacterium]|nr:MAG: flavodoxin family protein [Chloroflexota bacterium]
MNTVVIYDSKFGNTEKIAEAIARGIGSVSDVHVISVSEAARELEALATRPDLLIVGGPTQNHGPSAGLRHFTDALPASLRGVPAACFDTRYRGPVLLMGSAATAAAKAVAKAGAAIVGTPESFFIVRRGQMPLQTLEPGEIERAESWGRATASEAPLADPVAS